MPDVIDLIMQDHRQMEQLLERLRTDRSARAQLVEQAATMFIAHARAEEEHVYPSAVTEAGAEDQISEAEEEHQQAEQMMQRLVQTDPESPQFDELLMQLTEAIQHHVEEEETEVLPMLRESTEPADRQDMAELFQQRKDMEMQGAAAGTSGGEQIDLTKSELYEMAKKQDVPGRSQMSKEELAREVDQ